MVNPFPNNPWFLRVCSTSLLKTLWEKEKLLITSNFSFFSTVFSTHLENFPLFSSHLELKTLWEKEKLLVMSNFSFSHCVFYPFEELYAIFIGVKKSRLQTLSVWKSLQFVVWEWVQHLPVFLSVNYLSFLSLTIVLGACMFQNRLTKIDLKMKSITDVFQPFPKYKP